MDSIRNTGVTDTGKVELKAWHKPQLSSLDHADTFVNKDDIDTTEGVNGLGKSYGIPS